VVLSDMSLAVLSSETLGLFALSSTGKATTPSLRIRQTDADHSDGGMQQSDGPQPAGSVGIMTVGCDAGARRDFSWGCNPSTGDSQGVIFTMHQQIRERSMHCRRRLRSPVEQGLLGVIAETRRVVERCVVSRWHRTATNGLHDTFQLGCFPFCIVLLPVGEVEGVPGRVSGQVGGGNSRIPRRGSSAGMAAVTRLCKNRVYSGVSAGRARRTAHRWGGGHYVFPGTRTSDRQNAEQCGDQNRACRD